MTATRAAPITVGQTILGFEHIDGFPIGTVIGAARADWTKESATRWRAPNGNESTTHVLAQHRCTVRSFPDGEQTFTPAPPTVEQVRWKFRVGALAAARNHGVSTDMTIRTLERMGAKVPPLGNGVPVATDDNLPENTVIYTGNLADPNRFGVFRRKNGRWQPVLGEYTSPMLDGIVDSVDGVRERPAWLDEVGTEGDEEVGKFKATAWRIGYQLKREQRWCGVYEEVVRSLGISQDDARRYPEQGATPVAGQRVEPPQALVLPVGSLLIWRHADYPERWTLFVRSPHSSNQAGTIKIGGTDESHENYRRRMDVLAVAGSEGIIHWAVPTDPPGLVEHLPRGTWVTNSGTGQRYTVAADGRLWEGHTNRMRDTGGTTFEEASLTYTWIVARVRQEAL